MTTFIIVCAKYLVYVVAAVGLFYYWLTREWKNFGVFAALSLALAYILGWLAGKLWYDTRPFVADHSTPLIPHAANNGFPSDHMLLASAVASIVFVYNRALGLALWALALIVGLSRVAAGVHHLADIAGAAFVAIAATLISYWLQSAFPLLRDDKPQLPLP